MTNSSEERSQQKQSDIIAREVIQDNQSGVINLDTSLVNLQTSAALIEKERSNNGELQVTGDEKKLRKNSVHNGGNSNLVAK